MKLLRVFLATVVFGAMASLAYVAQQTEGAGSKMVDASQKFLASLDADQKKVAQFDYDSEERFNWNFIPLQDKDKKATRKGIPLVSLSPEQKKAALEVLKAGTSEMGAETAQLIMSLEGILKQEEKKGVNVRNPEWYFVTIFGSPTKTGKWGWRWEGHHLSINMTLEGTQVVASTPFFFGANPALIKTGEKKGTKVLGPAQDLAAEIFNSLSADQKKIAYHESVFPEPGQKEKSPKVGAPVGIPVAKLNEGQKEKLVKLLRHYTHRQPNDVAERDFKSIVDAGLDKIHFAYNGSTEEGKGRSYRIQGPTFVVEYLNVQADGSGNPNNHIHSSERKLKGDFGL